MKNAQRDTDIALIGGGIMSATLAILLHEKFPDRRLCILERLPKVAEESSEAWNNAGTGHSGNCELNYTPEIDGEINIEKAVHVAEQFHASLDFWHHCAEKGYLQDLGACLHELPHMSFVQGAENVEFLRKRWQAMCTSPYFETMEFSDDPAQISAWVPLMMQNRKLEEPIAATRIAKGYDVNFGAITDQLFAYLEAQENITLMLNEEVRDIERVAEHWLLSVRNLQTHAKWTLEAPAVFIGAGGDALLLLQDSQVEAGDGYGGFPVSGLWLRCINRSVIEQHHAKVYGKAEEGSPPMSVPHLDARMIEGKRELLFGPFAGSSPKFLKNGSMFDLLNSIELSNITSMLGAGLHNLPLVGYLLRQVTLSKSDRVAMLRQFYPDAREEDWEIVKAGQRVQIIKPDEKEWGKLQFGTEVIVTEDSTLAALLGASPGASTSYAIMQEVMEKCFADWTKDMV